MSLATPSVLPAVPPAPAGNKIDDDKSNNDVLNSSVRSLDGSFNMDRQPQAPRRSISPVPRRKTPEEPIGTTNLTNQSDSDGDSTVDGDSTMDEDLEYIARLYGADFTIEEEPDEDEAENNFNYPCRPGVDAGPDSPPPPPLRHVTEDENSPCQKKKHDYDGTKEPKRSSMRKANSRNVNSIDNSQHRSKEITRGVTRNHSADGTEDTRRGSGSLHSVRMRGSIYPVQQRRQSIGFLDTVRVQEVTPTVELNDGNTRDLWLQEDEAMEIKERRRTLLKRYKEKEARKKREAEMKRTEQEKTQRQQKVKNLLNPLAKTNKNNLNNFLTQNAAAKKHPRWGGILKKPDLSLPGGSSPAGHRWKANEHPSVMGISVPSRGGESSFTGLYMGAATSSFMSTSSGGSSISRENSDSFRGLEKYIDRSGKHQKNMVWDAVLIEQDEQLQFGYYDDERIASLYRTVQNQHDGQQKAVGRARKDRKAADNYLMTPRTLKLLKKTINMNDEGMSSLMLSSDMLEDATSAESAAEKADKDDNKDGDTKSKSDGLGNHAKSDTTDKADSKGNEVRKVSPKTSPNGSPKTESLKGKSYKKFLRRLSA